MSFPHTIDFGPEKEELLRLKGEGERVMEWETVALRAVKRTDIYDFFKVEANRELSIEDLYKHTHEFLMNRYNRLLIGCLSSEDTTIGDISIREHEDDEFYFGINMKKEYRGYGFGTKLTQMGIEYARDHYHDLVDRLLLKVDTQNQRAVHVYQKAGYQIIDERPYVAEDSGCERTQYVMEALL